MARKKSDIHYIYKTTCLITNRFYVGMHSTCKLEDGYMGSGTRLRHSIRKYGVENHIKEILEFCSNREELVAKEIEIVTTEFINDDLCMNLKEGGHGGFTSEQQKLNVAKANAKMKVLKETNPEWVEKRKKKYSDAKKKEHAERTRKPIKFDWSGLQHSDESKKLMSDKAKKRIGDKNSQYGTCWITRDGENKKIKVDDLDLYVKEGWVKGRK